MKSIYLVFATLFSLSYSQAQTGDDRNVYWAHSLGGNSSSWNTIRLLFDEERKMNTKSSTYTSDIGIANARNQVVTHLSSLFPGGEYLEDRNIGIGHSMGGVVLRDIDRIYTVEGRRFGGLITVGTPNQGAAIVNSIQSGAVEDAYDDACRRLSAGPLSMLPIQTVVIQGVASSVICDIIFVDLIEPLLDNQLHASALDLAVGSSALGELSSGNVPIINVWGDELQPVHWRLISSYTSNNQNDTEWVELSRSFRNTYNTFYTVQLTTSIVSAVFGFLNPDLWKKSALQVYRARQWGHGVNWFDQSETIWNSLIQCKDGTITTPITVEEYYHPSDCDNLLGPLGELTLDWAHCLQNCSGGDLCVEEYTIYAIQHVSKNSDGFICNTGQIMPGLSSGNIYRADGVNHSEEVMHDEMINQMRLIWETRPIGDFFLTERR